MKAGKAPLSARHKPCSGRQALAEVQLRPAAQKMKDLAAVKAQPLGIELHPHQGRPGLPAGLEGQAHVLKRPPRAHLVDAPGHQGRQQQRPQQQRPQVPPDQGGQGGQGPNQRDRQEIGK